MQAVTAEISANTSVSNKEVQPMLHHNTDGENDDGTLVLRWELMQCGSLSGTLN